MFKERFMIGLGCTFLAAPFLILALSHKEMRAIDADEYERIKLSCSFSEDVESYYLEGDKIVVYCYDGSIKWIDRGSYEQG